MANQYSITDKVWVMGKPKSKRFHGSLPEESYAIVKETAERIGMSVKSFLPMATIKYVLEF